MENTNRKDVLEGVRIELLQQLQGLQGAPNVAIQQLPPPFRRRAPEDEETPTDQQRETRSHAAELSTNIKIWRTLSMFLGSSLFSMNLCVVHYSMILFGFDGQDNYWLSRKLCVRKRNISLNRSWVQSRKRDLPRKRRKQ